MKKEKNSSWFYFCYQQCARNHLSEDDIYLEVWRFDGFSRIGWRLLSIVCWPGYPRLSQSHNSLDPRNPEMPPCMNIDADYRSWSMFMLWLDLCCHTYLKNICVSLVTFAREFAMWCSSSQSSTWKNLNMSLFVIYLLLNLLYLTFVCDQEINEFYLFICMWPGVDDFLTKTGHRVCQCYMFNFCIFELLWIQMVKETADRENTNKLFAISFRDYTCGKPDRQLWSF